MINKTIAKLLLFFPLTGLLGLHQLYIYNFKKFFIRLIFCWFFGIFWIYDLFNYSKDLNEVYEKELNNLDKIIKLLDEGELGEAFKLFVKTGKTQIYVREIIKRGQGGVIVKHFADNEKDKKHLEKLIRNGDTESLAFCLTTYYTKMKAKQLLKF